MRVTAYKFRAITNAGCLRCTCSVEVEIDIKLKIHQCRVVQQPGHLAWPSLPQGSWADRDRKTRYFPLIELPKSVEHEVKKTILRGWEEFKQQLSQRGCRHFKSADFLKPVTLTIDALKFALFDDGEKPALSFQGTDQQLILNKTKITTMGLVVELKVTANNKLQQIATTKKGELSVLQRAFLAAFAECGTVTFAALAAKVHRSRHYRWLDEQAYATAFEVAKNAAAETLENEARRRAVEGVTEAVYYQGEVVGTIQKYSDVLLIFLLKGALPAKYKDRREVTGAVTATVADPGRHQLTDADLDKLIAIAESNRSAAAVTVTAADCETTADH